MIDPATRRPRRPRAGAFRRDRRGVAALETALLALPFLGLLLPTLSIGVFYMTQSWLDAGVLSAATTVRVAWERDCSAAATASSIKPQIIANAAGGISSTNLQVDMSLLSTLAASARPIADGYTDPSISSATGGAVVLRAAMPVNLFFPGITVLTATSMAVIRRRACGGAG